MEMKTMGGPGVGGLHPANLDIRVLASNAFTKGDHGQFDFLGGTDTDPGNAASGFVKFKDPVFTDATSTSEGVVGWYGVCLEDIASGAYGWVRARGVVNANVDGACAAGKALIAATDGQLDPTTGGTNKKVIAIGLMADSPTNFADVVFDGISGFGNDVGSNVST